MVSFLYFYLMRDMAVVGVHLFPLDILLSMPVAYMNICVVLTWIYASKFAFCLG